MDAISIIILVLVGVVILEVSKHLFTRTALKLIVILIVIMVLFFTILGSLSIDQSINSDNEYIQTGASIAKTVNEEPLIVKIKDSIKESVNELRETIAKALKTD
jgi:predicted PurR-regulated permease PerM